MTARCARAGPRSPGAALVAGGYNLLSGIAAVADDDTLTSRATEVLYGISVTGWGWFWLIAGVVQLGVGGLIIARNAYGLWLGVSIAFLSALMTVFVIFIFPLWSIAVLTLDFLVAYALVTHSEESSSGTERQGSANGGVPGRAWIYPQADRGASLLRLAALPNPGQRRLLGESSSGRTEQRREDPGSSLRRGGAMKQRPEPKPVGGPRRPDTMTLRTAISIGEAAAFASGSSCRHGDGVRRARSWRRGMRSGSVLPKTFTTAFSSI